MIRVCLEVREATSLSRATVRAASISEAVSVTRVRYPGHEVRVMFPIDPERFFIEGPANPKPGVHRLERRGEQEDA